MTDGLSSIRFVSLNEAFKRLYECRGGFERICPSSFSEPVIDLMAFKRYVRACTILAPAQQAS